MKAVVTKVVKSVNVSEDKTTVVFKVSDYTTEQITVDGQYSIKPGQTLLVTITNVETE